MQYSDLVISADMIIPDTHTLIVFSPHRVTEFSLQGVDVMLVGVNFFLQRFNLTDCLILGLYKCSHQILHTHRETCGYYARHLRWIQTVQDTILPISKILFISTNLYAWTIKNQEHFIKKFHPHLYERTHLSSNELRSCFTNITGNEICI